MKRFDSDYGQEFERLKKMEFADRFEPATRLVAVCTAGSLIWIYTGWTSALLWPVYYAAAIFAHLFYIMKIYIANPIANSNTNPVNKYMGKC